MAATSTKRAMPMVVWALRQQPLHSRSRMATTRELVSAHPHMAKVVEKELAIPEHAGERGHQEIGGQARLFNARWQFDQLAQCPVLCVQVKAVEGRGDECADISENVNDVPSEYSRPVLLRYDGDRFPGDQREAIHRRQHARQQRKRKPFGQGKL